MLNEHVAAVRSIAAKPDADGQTPWPGMIARIQANDASGMEELYDVFSRGIRFYLWRHLGKQDLDDTVHDIFVAVSEAIRRGDVREPERLMGFVWTVVRRQRAAHIERTMCVRNQTAELDGDV